MAVDRTASSVTSQAGCENDIYIKSDEDKLKALGAQKRYYADLVRFLKQELKIKKNWKNGNNVPPHILNNSKYYELRDTSQKLAELDIKINALNKKVKSNVTKHHYESMFLDLVRDRYPKIYEEVKTEIKKIIKHRA